MQFAAEICFFNIYTEACSVVCVTTILLYCDTDRRRRNNFMHTSCSYIDIVFNPSLNRQFVNSRWVGRGMESEGGRIRDRLTTAGP